MAADHTSPSRQAIRNEESPRLADALLRGKKIIMAIDAVQPDKNPRQWVGWNRGESATRRNTVCAAKSPQVSQISYDEFSGQTGPSYYNPVVRFRCGV